MDVYTIQLAKHRLCVPLEIPIIDITAKSGIPQFAPTMPDVVALKQGKMEWDAYVDIYIKKLRNTWMYHRHQWDMVLSMPCVAVACYCSYGKNCHRYVWVDVLKKVASARGIAVNYIGDITEETKR